MYNIILVISIINLFILVYLGLKNELVYKFRINTIEFEFAKKMQLSYEDRYAGFKILESMPSYRGMLFSIGKLKSFLPKDIRDEFIKWEKMPRKPEKNASV